MRTCFFFRNRPPEESLHQKCRTFRAESDYSTPEVVRGFWVAVFEASRQTVKNAAWTIENSPDKKMRVGSLRNPWECDGRLPPDAGYYLNLVLPRNEEPRKKIGSRVRLLHGRMLQIQWSIYMQLYSRILVNLLVNDQFICNILPCDNLTRLPIFFGGSFFRGITRFR